MAEVNESEQKEQESSSQATLNEEKIAEMIKGNVSSSMKEVLANLQKEQQENQRNQQQQENVNSTTTNQEDDIWDQIINSKVGGRITQANMNAEAADDRVDFYSSDLWLEEVNEWLTEDDPDKRKAEKQEFKTELEKRFKNLLQQGKGFKREVIAQQLLGEKISKDRIKYQESIGRRTNKKQEDELAKAARAVDISSGNMSNFKPEEIHAMDYDTVIKKYGSLTF